MGAVALFGVACSAPAPQPEPASAAEPLAPAQAERWALEFEPYVWLPSTHGSGSTDTTPSLDIDLVGTLDAALPLAFSARSPDGRFVVLTDGFYLRLRDDEGPLRTTTEVGMLEAGAGIALDDARHWHALAGLRYVDIRYDVGLGPLSGRLDADWLDPWIGARGEYALGNRFAGMLRGDVGGFGVGTEFTWQALAVLRARLAEHVAIDLGYRAIDVDYRSGVGSFDVLFHGPIAGLGVSF